MPKLPATAVGDAIRRVAHGLQPNPISFAEFFKQAWPIIEPATPLQWNWHLDLVLESLEAVTLGLTKRLVINIPPRSLKSIITSVMWPAWSWTQAPWSRWVFSSYAAGLSTELSTKRRRIIKSDWYQERWGFVRLVDDNDLKTQFENDQTGRMQSTSTGGTITGMGGDIIVIDDPQNPKMAESKLERESANRHYSDTLVTRLNNKKTGSIVLVMQRLHKDDTTGIVLRECGWTCLDLQAIAEKRRPYIFPLSKQKHIVEAGQLLHQDREGQKELDGLLRSMGSRTFNAQYLQRPTSESGNIWKKHWWQEWSLETLPKYWDAVIQSWDCAFTKSEDSSFVVGQVWGLIGAKKYLLDQVRKRMNYPETKAAIANLTLKWPLSLAKLVENKANGPALMQEMTQTIPGIIPINPEGDKVVRANAVSATIEAGDVYLPPASSHPWVTAFLEECSEFPEGSNDDQVDATSQALHRLNQITRLPKEVPEPEGEESVLEDFQDTEIFV